MFLLLCLFAASATAKLRTYTYGGSGKDALRAEMLRKRISLSLLVSYCYQALLPLDSTKKKLNARLGFFYLHGLMHPHRRSFTPLSLCMN